MMYVLDYRCFGADLQGENERECILYSKKLINNEKKMNTCLKKKIKPVSFNASLINRVQCAATFQDILRERALRNRVNGLEISNDIITNSIFSGMRELR